MTREGVPRGTGVGATRAATVRLLQATLWQGQSEASAIVRVILRGLCELAGIPLAVVDTQEEVLAAAARASDTGPIVIDCFHGEPSDIDRCIAVAAQIHLRLYIVHPRATAVRQVEEAVGRPVVWLPARATMPDLLDVLHGLRALADQAARAQHPLLTEREREVAGLVADGCTNAEIAARLYITEDTARKHVQTILHKFGVSSRRVFSRVYRAGGPSEKAPSGIA